MSKGRPRAAARQAPSPLPAIRPRSRARPPAGPSALACSPGRPSCTSGSPGPAFPPSLPACSPPPPSHTFPPLAVTMLLRGPPSFLPRRGSPPTDLAARIFSRLTEQTPPPHLSRISNLLGLKMQTHRMLFTRLSEVGWVLLHHSETARLFIRSCFQEGVGFPPLFLPRRLQASGF